MISIYPSSKDNVKAVNYLPVKCDTFKDISKYALASMWSPILFKDNYRLKENFLQSDWCALDIDNTLTLSEVIETLETLEIKSVVLSTQNHQKPKNGIVCDRMRIIMRWHKRITDLQTYEFNYKLWNDTFRGDKSTCEGGRHFKASIKYLFHRDGNDLRVVKPPPKIKFNKFHIYQKMDFKFEKKLPEKVLAFVEHGILIGSGRQDSFFKASCILRAIGVSQDDAKAILIKAPININNFDFEREFNHAVNSAYKY